jgi:sterol desaturase/sphingolipid hydroxylase (fatty acid hydroxylase superfamily)
MIWWLEYVADIALGFIHQGVSVLCPFRQQSAKPEIFWDIIGIAASGLFATVFYFCFDPLLGLLYQLVWLIQWQNVVAQWPVAVTVVCFTLVTDCAVYWAHRLLHSRWLWSTHAWHHSPRYVYWASGLRGSPVHIALTLAPASFAYLLFPFDGYGTLIIAVTVFHLANQHYLHSNIWLPAQRQLEWMFITPRFHFVHHSSTPTRTNSNYGFVFSFWDRLFGTYADPDTVPADDPLGLDYEISNARLLLGLPPQPRQSTYPAERSPT